MYNVSSLLQEASVLSAKMRAAMQRHDVRGVLEALGGIGTG